MLSLSVPPLLLAGTGFDRAAFGADDRPQKICNGHKMGGGILRAGGLPAIHPAGVSHVHRHQLHHLRHLHPPDVPMPDDGGIDADLHPAAISDRSPAAVTYPPEADCGHFRDAAVFPRHPGGGGLHPGRHETCGDIRGFARLECTVMPLMVSATETAEELSAAAVTRGIENPARKTSAVSPAAFPSGFFGDAGRPGLAGALICGTIGG